MTIFETIITTLGNHFNPGTLENQLLLPFEDQTIIWYILITNIITMIFVIYLPISIAIKEFDDPENRLMISVLL